MPGNALLQAESAGPSAAAPASRLKAQEVEEDSEPEGSEVSYDSDEPQEHPESDADSDGGKRQDTPCMQHRSVNLGQNTQGMALAGLHAKKSADLAWPEEAIKQLVNHSFECMQLLQVTGPWQFVCNMLATVPICSGVRL